MQERLEKNQVDLESSCAAQGLRPGPASLFFPPTSEQHKIWGERARRQAWGQPLQKPLKMVCPTMAWTPSRAFFSHKSLWGSPIPLLTLRSIPAQPQASGPLRSCRKALQSFSQMTLSVPWLMLLVGEFYWAHKFFIAVLVCFENIGVISQILKEFYFTLQAGLIFGLTTWRAEPLCEREKELKRNDFSKKFQERKMVLEVEVHLRMEQSAKAGGPLQGLHRACPQKAQPV